MGLINTIRGKSVSEGSLPTRQYGPSNLHSTIGPSRHLYERQRQEKPHIVQRAKIHPRLLIQPLRLGSWSHLFCGKPSPHEESRQECHRYATRYLASLSFPEFECSGWCGSWRLSGTPLARVLRCWCSPAESTSQFIEILRYNGQLTGKARSTTRFPIIITGNAKI